MSTHLSIALDEGTIEEITAKLDLRPPNATALWRIASAMAEAAGEPIEVVVEVATAVGKTFVAAGLIDYAAAEGVRNFAIITPSRAIQRKTLANFSRGNPKEIQGRSTTPHLITPEDFARGSVRSALENDSAVKLFVFTVQQLIRPEDKTSRKVRKFQEQLGSGLYDYLRSAGDLVVIADEHHSYYGPKFSDAVRELDAMALVGLTATVAPKTPESQIIYRYSLGQAIADGLVKVPVLVGRKDDRTDLETQLLDGVALLNAKRAALETYCERTGKTPINPVMFIVCQSINDADEVAEILKRPNFFGSDYDKAVLSVHSDADDSVFDDLANVEEPGSPVRAIVSVSMLKEGWDVKNIYVICALRALASNVLTEQTLGRGLRLPFGKLTDVEMLDTVEVLAHDRYEQLLSRAGVLVRSLVADRTGETATLSSSDAALEGVSSPDGAPVPAPVSSDGTTHFGSGVPGIEGTVIRVADTTARQAALSREVKALSQIVSIPDGVEPFHIPVITSLPLPKQFSLSDVDEDEFRHLGQSLAASPEDVLRRNRLEVVRTPGGGFEVKTVPASDVVSATLPDFDLGEGKEALVQGILNQGLVRADPPQIAAARRLAAAFVEGVGADAERRLAAFLHAALDLVRGALTASYRRAPEQSELKVSEQPLFISRINSRPVTANRYEPVDRAHPVAYEGWAHSLVPLAWFDSDPERQMAVLLDESAAISRWVRLQQGEVVVAYEGRSYNPDFVAEDAEGVCWLIEVKADNEIDADDVVAKRVAAERWARYASDHLSPRRWRYLLASETDLKHAKGNWALLVAQASARQ